MNDRPRNLSLWDESGATFSPCGTYRYLLWRTWYPGSGKVAWIMLNPSTADAESNDPTVRRTIGFSRAWGYGGEVVLNIFALRSTDPRVLRSHPDPIGPENDDAILQGVSGCDLVIAAWGNWGRLHGRGKDVLDMLRGIARVHHMGLTTHGHPRHPLYLDRGVKPLAFEDTCR